MRGLRRAAWALGAPVRAALVAAIVVYRWTLAGALGGQCRFFPTCSRYAHEAIRVHGAARGLGLAVWRLLRCQPFGRGGVDPVPPRRVAAEDDHACDAVIHRTPIRGAA